MNQGTNVSERGGVVAGLFHESGRGDRALVDLKSAGFTRVEISQVDGAEPRETTERETAGNTETSSAVPFFAEHDSSASSFTDELVRLGFSRHDAHDLVDGLVKGDVLITADAASDLNRAVSILQKHGADIRYTSGSAQSTAANPTTSTSGNEDREIQLRAERLVINKQRVQHGEARIRKEIVTEMKSVDVPVSHEELVIERHAVTSTGDDSAPIAAETIRIPLTEERVIVSKETVMREEVEVGTRRVEDVAHVADSVRHEELRVNDSTVRPAATAVPRPKP